MRFNTIFDNLVVAYFLGHPVQHLVDCMHFYIIFAVLMKYNDVNNRQNHCINYVYNQGTLCTS